MAGREPTRFHILAIGAIYQDVVLRVPTYPAEDTKLRATSQERRLGGNVINTLTVLHEILDRDFTPAGESWGMWIVSSVGREGGFVSQELEKRGVVGLLQRHEGVEMATAYIISADSGSRSIVTVNSVPDPTYAQLSWQVLSPLGSSFGLKGYSWYHIEGRNCEAVLELFRKDLGRQEGMVSVELERPGRSGIEALLEYADVIFVSELYCKSSVPADSYSNDSEMVETFLKKFPKGPWSQSGFITLGSRGCVVFRSRPAFDTDGTGIPWFWWKVPCPPLGAGERIVETSGAGDTFVAAVIYAMGVWKMLPVEAARVGNVVAGRKCCRSGFRGVWDGVDKGLLGRAEYREFAI
ncbi:hypothetical protein RUND412_005888 [Rhizina undulata]